MKNTPAISRFGDEAIRLTWPIKIDISTHQLMMAWVETLSQQYEVYVLDYTLSYNELLLYMRDPEQIQLFLDELEQLRSASINSNDRQGETIYIPVCYHQEFAADLQSFCDDKSIGIDDLIRLHTKVHYPVHFIGFLPGFPYLGDLDEKLYKPRKKKPRSSVPEGSVGIAGQQTGVYPTASPGGWNIIGRSPMKFFDAESTPPSLLKPGDVIRFYSISIETFHTLKNEIAQHSIESLREQHEIYYKRYD